MRAALEANVGLRAPLARILDRRAATGVLPARVTVDATPEVESSIADLFSRKAVRRVAPGRVRIELSQAPGWTSGDLDAALHAALGIAPRNRREEAEELAQLATGMLRDVAREARTPAAAAYLDEELALARAGKGDWTARLRVEPREVVRADLARLVRCVDAAATNVEPVRLATFSARVAGSSKWLVEGDRARKVGAILAAHDAATRDELASAAVAPGARVAARAALEGRGIFRDEGAISVLCFGPIVYRKGDRSFDHVAMHAGLGEPCRLTLQQLRGASVEAPGAERVTVIENLTPFFERVEQLGSARRLDTEVVVASEGQASWAVVSLVRALHRSGLPVRHAGDLDRAGVLVARSLAGRAGVPIELLAMDVATHRRFVDRGLPLERAEAARLRALLESDPPDAPAHELLEEVARTGRWIEQERFLAEALRG